MMKLAAGEASVSAACLKPSSEASERSSRYNSRAIAGNSRIPEILCDIETSAVTGHLKLKRLRLVGLPVFIFSLLASVFSSVLSLVPGLRKYIRSGLA